MSKQRKNRKEDAKSKQPISRIFLVVLGIAALIAGVVFFRRAKTSPSEVSGPVTYSKDIAPILYGNCAACHRKGESAPFELLTFENAKAHAKDIVRVTHDRIMPPFLPAGPRGEFMEDRRLEDRDIALIQKWVADGMPEGNPGDLPQKPEWPAEWRLGKPDLVVELPEFTLPAEGKDVYFNFVAPIPTSANRYVSGVEFLPGSRTVHHAFIMADETRASRRQAARNNPPGFYGMDVPESAVIPGGQLLGWQPGKIPSVAGPGMSWVLHTNTDLVLQTHLNPSGKPEPVRPKLGFHFTDIPPTNTAFRLRLTTLELDIPPGQSNYVAESSYVLPVDLEFIRAGAHAHYLCKKMEGFATLPNGETKSLLLINDWDFKWQGDYQYRNPFTIPKGSKVTMRFTYDNTSNNPRNPFNPPQRVRWGLNTTDEMGELYFQTVPRNRRDYETLIADFSRYALQVSLGFYQFRIRTNPNDSEAHQRLGRALSSLGQMAEAHQHLDAAIRLNPKDDKAYFDLGAMLLRQGRREEAFNCFQNVVRLNPDDSQAFGSLGIIALQAGRKDEARGYLESALRLNPEDALALRYLQSIRQ